ncbi:MAG TPA: diguanylate cyclase, partial [Bacilli bacterium]|nr:diguanylate cyclase [Bacilli bacterium]
MNFRKFSQDINNVWQLFKNMNDGLLITNENLEVIAINPAFNRITGYSFQEVAGKNPSFLQSGKTTNDVYQEMWRSILEYGSWTGELINVRKSGEQFCSFITITHIKNDENKPSYFIGVMRDITERRQTEEKISYLAYHDPLTQLPNRALFMKELRRTIQETKGTDKTFPLLFLDLNDFKKINDTFGHQVGDQLLIQLGDRLAELIGENGITSRFGGDEFTVMLYPEETTEKVEAKIAELLRAFEEPFICSGEQLFITSSIGVSYYPEHGRDIHTLVKNADRAMYKSKEMRQNTIEVYNEWYEAEANDRLHLEHELRRAVRLNQLEVFYQLQVDVSSGKPFGVEALVRWNHPDKGVVAPNIFLPLAKETGLIAAIDEWVITRACRQVKRW